MSDPNFEGCASFFEKAEREARETTDVKINVYACSLRGANTMSIYGCAGCKSLSKDPVEIMNVPKSVIEQGKEIEYVDKHSKFGIVKGKLNCGSKALI